MFYLFSAVGGQIKCENREKRDTHTGNDDVNCIKQRLAPHCDVERDIQIRLITARVELFISETHFNRSTSVFAAATFE